MTSSLRSAGFALLLCAASAVAHAHNVWLLPSSTILSKDDWVTVDAAVSNDLFFFNHNPLALDNLSITAPDGTEVKAENMHKGKLRSVFDLHLSQPGTYRLAILNSGVFARWTDKASSQPKRVRGTPETIADLIPADARNVEITQMAGRIETFVTVGTPSTLRPVGKGLELVASHPTDLVKGERTNFALRIDGQPAKDLEVVVTPGNTRYRDKMDEIKVKTDADGRFVITWPQAGMYWLEVSTSDTNSSVPQARERRLSYAATLEVMP